MRARERWRGREKGRGGEREGEERDRREKERKEETQTERGKTEAITRKPHMAFRMYHVNKCSEIDVLAPPEQQLTHLALEKVVVTG